MARISLQVEAYLSVGDSGIKRVLSSPYTWGDGTAPFVVSRIHSVGFKAWFRHQAARSTSFKTITLPVSWRILATNDQGWVSTNFCYTCDKRFPRKDCKRCAKCRVAKYCSKECVTKHWFAGHKERCRCIIILALNKVLGYFACFLMLTEFVASVQDVCVYCNQQAVSAWKQNSRAHFAKEKRHGSIYIMFAQSLTFCA
jgi:hypothetical protein